MSYHLTTWSKTLTQHIQCVSISIKTSLFWVCFLSLLLTSIHYLVKKKIIIMVSQPRPRPIRALRVSGGGLDPKGESPDQFNGWRLIQTRAGRLETKLMPSYVAPFTESYLIVLWKLFFSIARWVNRARCSWCVPWLLYCLCYVTWALETWLLQTQNNSKACVYIHPLAPINCPWVSEDGCTRKRF